MGDANNKYCYLLTIILSTLRQSLIVTDEKEQNYVDVLRPILLCIQQDRKCAYKRSIGVRLPNHCGSGKEVSITYSDCMSVALVLQHAKRLRRIVMPFVACVVPPSFFTLSHTRHDIRKQLLNTLVQYVF